MAQLDPGVTGRFAGHVSRVDQIHLLGAHVEVWHRNLNGLSATRE
jgi:hypothetical protein